MKFRAAPNGEKPGSYQLATRIDKQIINPGDTLEFEQYITGYGEIKNSKIQVYISTGAFNLKQSYVTSSLRKDIINGDTRYSWGNQRDPLSDIGYTMLPAGITLNSAPELGSAMIFDAQMFQNNTPSTEPILMSEMKVIKAPFEYHLISKKDITPGDQYIDFYFTYFNGEKWTTNKERVNFKVRNFFERHTTLTTSLAIIASLSAITRFIILPIYDYTTSYINQHPTPTPVTHINRTVQPPDKHLTPKNN
ncbi:hypothetical protein [Pseudomonas monteilii]|uniref:hypothetical protein n=1 Tax=Pseudomonas monteilii TaxID=76759 RepID=UPI0011842C94|nr:hypothetical protein [Pseudomonas monteilii]